MEHQLYIRIRGRILGPYDQDKLQSLAKRGQLSRLHELSQDTANWVPALTYPELFLVEERHVVVKEQPSQVAVHNSLPQQEPAPASMARRWWYRRNGSEVGPVDEATLQQALATGNLAGDDIVWAEGMPQWVAARQVPGLLPFQGTASPQSGYAAVSSGTPDAQLTLPATLCKAAVSARPWLLFVAIVAFIWAGLSIAGGILLLIAGAKEHVSVVVAQGLFAIIFGVDYAAGGLLLLNYASRVGGLRYGPHPIVLEKSLDSLRTFWLFVSINLIIFMAFVGVLFIWGLAIGSTFPLV